ncbi:MAG: hypothetical protein IJ772_05045 [Bacilli bacterium]|nr:hypothetical protein [Bacilli bacterium]
MGKNKVKLLKLPIINERFLASILKVLSSQLQLTKRFLSNVEYLFNLIDMQYYSKDVEVFVLIKSCIIAVKHRRMSPSFDPNDLIGEISSVIPESFSDTITNLIIPTINLGFQSKNPSELQNINDIVDIYLKYAAIIISKDKMNAALTNITSGSMESLQKSVSNYRNLIDQTAEEFRKTDSVSNSNIINSIDEDFTEILMETYDELKNPKYSLKTGLKMFNQMLSEEGGFKSSCYYIFYALVNSFKSGMLQYCEKWIRKYNSDNYLKLFNETGLIPTILYYSFENTRTENMQREFYMETGIQLKDVATKEEAKRLWQEHYNSTGSIINVAYVYAEANTVRVSDMRRQIHALNDAGYKVIAVIADYLELIRPEDEDMNSENRLKLGYISNAFHVMTVTEDIVGITAQQMNRAAEAAISELRNKGVSNLIDQVNGMQYIGESIGIEKPADVSMYIGTERSIYDNELYLTIKRGKCRYRQTPTRYMVNKLKNGFYIEDDLLTDKVLSKPAIAPETEGDVKEITNVVSRTMIAQKKKDEEKEDKKKEEKKKIIVKKNKKIEMTEEEGDNFDTFSIVEDILSKKREENENENDEFYKEVSKYPSLDPNMDEEDDEIYAIA